MIRPQKHFRQSNQGLMAWDVERLIALSATLDIREVRIDELPEIDELYWYSLGGATPTCRNIAEHAQLINEADLKYPILLDVEGRVMDGMHRVCKALHLNLDVIKAKQFTEFVTPDYVGEAAEAFA